VDPAIPRTDARESFPSARFLSHIWAPSLPRTKVEGALPGTIARLDGRWYIVGVRVESGGPIRRQLWILSVEVHFSDHLGR